MAFRYNPSGLSNRLLGAAFLMATAAIGPGFITQTTVFTGQLGTSFAFAIFLSILIDIIIQLNIWLVTVGAGKPAPQLANEVAPGLGGLLAVLIAAGGLIFNIGNIAGCSLALHSLFGWPYAAGAVVSTVLAITVFAVQSFGRAMDYFVKVMGIVMIGLLLYVACQATPPVYSILVHTIFPEKINWLVTLTLVGGTVGGYISFAGAHRLLDTGLQGTHAIPAARNAAVTGILISGLMRLLLFAVVAGVLAAGFVLPAENPASAVFEKVAGFTGLVLFGIILWAASITSVVAAAYTSVSFLSALSVRVALRTRQVIIVFMLASAAVFLVAGSPTRLLVWAGTLNGLVLPLALAIMLIAAGKPRLLQHYRHARWLLVSGWMVCAVLTGMALYTLWNVIGQW